VTLPLENIDSPCRLEALPSSNKKGADEKSHFGFSRVPL
jgi:hypothetical protein